MFSFSRCLSVFTQYIIVSCGFGLLLLCTGIRTQGNDGAELKAHRAVLAIASPVFRVMLNSPMKEGALGDLLDNCNMLQLQRHNELKMH